MKQTAKQTAFTFFAAALIASAAFLLAGCAPQEAKESADTTDLLSQANDKAQQEQPQQEAAQAPAATNAQGILASIDYSEDYRASFSHGPKGAEYQKYIVLHDTEGGGSASGVIDYWDNSGNGVAAHFIVNKDGSVVQCVPLDEIAHHAGFGNTGNNEKYGTTDESRDDKVGTTSIGSSYADYGMNSYSVGIEMVHVGGEGDYPAAQLEALDKLIAYIDAYYGFESTIIDHKTWRAGNSDTSPEFADYLASYQEKRTHA